MCGVWIVCLVLKHVCWWGEELNSEVPEPIAPMGCQLLVLVPFPKVFLS